jgi:hypothetical protein
MAGEQRQNAQRRPQKGMRDRRKYGVYAAEMPRKRQPRTRKRVSPAGGWHSAPVAFR